MEVICSDGLRIAVREDAAAGTLELGSGSEKLLAFRAIGDADPRWVAGVVTVRKTGDGLLIHGGRYRQLQCQQLPAEPTPGILSGTVSKRDRMALPPGTRIKVILADVSRADAPMREIASTAIVTRDNQAPFHFLIRYDPASLDMRSMTAVSARIEAPDGRLLYITDTRTDGPAPEAAPSPVELLLVPVRSGA